LGAPWAAGAVYLASLDWEGAPAYSVDFAHARPEHGWTQLRGYWRLEDGAYHGSGPGLCETYTGAMDWDDYTLEVELSPLTGAHHNINVRVRGALYSYAFGLAPGGKVALYKKMRDYQQVAAADFDWRHGETYRLKITAQGNTFTASVAGADMLCWTDDDAPYRTGQVGLSAWHGGHTAYKTMRISSL
jgi:hypothetical protein